MQAKIYGEKCFIGQFILGRCSPLLQAGLIIHKSTTFHVGKSVTLVYSNIWQCRHSACRKPVIYWTKNFNHRLTLCNEEHTVYYWHSRCYAEQALCSCRASVRLYCLSVSPAAAGLLLWTRRAEDIVDRLLYVRYVARRSVAAGLQCYVVSRRMKPWTSAWLWLGPGSQCPLASWGEQNFENLITKWCILKYIWINTWSE